MREAVMSYGKCVFATALGAAFSFTAADGVAQLRVDTKGDVPKGKASPAERDVPRGKALGTERREARRPTLEDQAATPVTTEGIATSPTFRSTKLIGTPI